MKNNDNIKPSEKVVQELLYPKSGLNAIYSICTILQIPAYVIAEELDISRPRMSQYRNGESTVPESRMVAIAEFLESQISDIEKEIVKEKRKSPDKIRSMLIADLERRVELARKIGKI